MKLETLPLIMKHLSIAESILLCAKRTVDLAKGNNIEGVVFETENKERLIKELSRIQLKIEADIQIQNNLEKETIDSWHREFNELLAKINLQGTTALLILEKAKEETSFEISTVYKNKQQLKGYNLNDLRK